MYVLFTVGREEPDDVIRNHPMSRADDTST